MTESCVANIFIQWAQKDPGISALNLIGSQARYHNQKITADIYSDWDFQLVVRQPSKFLDVAWVKRAGMPPPLAYVVRPSRLGSTEKVSIVFSDGALDLVLIPALQMRMAKLLCKFGLVSRSRRILDGLTHLSTVLRPGYRLLKGEALWGQFLHYVCTEIPPSRISDDEILSIAEGFVCDYVSTKQKIARGEFVAAQRWLHFHLVEVNFRILHELRQRAGDETYPDARRLEVNTRDFWNTAVTVQAIPERESLELAVEKCAQVFCELAEALVGRKWAWPSGHTLLLRRK